ncbi:hypothetical protein [Anatilimnocola floriformis]|uniref:hypothetical protein n=1 Tax=Anatilimnocola floriformis TaxID=2948575 RepID=UPI0020C43E6C|nr:hypothetical protein [Anatilimnocola floriformis]
MPPEIDPRRRAWLFAGALVQMVSLFGVQPIFFRLKLPLLALVFQLLGMIIFLVCLAFGCGLLKPAKPRLSLRDLFWLTLLAAIAIGWGVERWPLMHEMTSSKGYQRYYYHHKTPDPATVKREAIYKHLRTLTDAELQVRLRQEANWWGDDEFNGCLAELLRRRNSAALQEQHTRMYETSRRTFGTFETWPVLTAWRRSEQQPDPLRILVEAPTTADARPQITVTIQNVDQLPVVFTENGIQNHDREEQLQVYLTDDAGKRQPLSNFDVTYPMLKFGTKVRYPSRIQPGERNAAPFIVDIRKYLAPPATGQYKLHVVFSNKLIAGERNLDGLTLCHSEPISVWVENRVPRPREYFAVYSVLIVLAIIAASLIFSFFQRLRQQATPEAPLQRFADWRGYAALAVALLLTYGWLLDVRHLSAEIERLRPHDVADWSIRSIE